MKTEYIDIEGKWGVVICYDFDMLDADEMAAIMDSFGSTESSIRKSMPILLGTNTGMCISRSDLRMSVVFVGDASSSEQWWDTLEHELYHVASAVCEYYGAPHGGEDFAWTVGYLTRRAVELFGRPCR